MHSPLPVPAQAGSEADLSEVIVARTVDEVESLRVVWEAAGVRDIDSDIDYFLTVVRCLPGVLGPHVVLVRRAGRPPLVAVARLEWRRMPLTIGYRTMMQPRLRAIVVTFGGLLGTAGADDEKVLINELRRALDIGEADMLLVPKIDVHGTLRDVVVDGAAWLMRSHAQPTTRRWVASVPESLDAFLSSRSAKTRQRLRTRDRKLIGEYGDGLRLRRFEHPGEMSELCRDMETVASKTYQRGLGVGYSGSPLDLGLIEIGLRRGWFRAWILYALDQPVAFWSGTKYAGTFVTRHTSFDPDYTKYAIGTYTLLRMVEDLCLADDVTWLDFGSGEAEYKAAFATAQRIESDVFVVRHGLRPMTMNLAVTTSSLVNIWGRHLAQETDWGRRLKRVWRRRMARRAAKDPAQ